MQQSLLQKDAISGTERMLELEAERLRLVRLLLDDFDSATANKTPNPEPGDDSGSIEAGGDVPRHLYTVSKYWELCGEISFLNTDNEHNCVCTCK